MSDGVVLVGLPGSGKSTVGRLLASALGRPFVDTDEVIAGEAGRPAGVVLSELGDPAFREIESRALDGALRRSGSVIATGGGALDDPLNRWRLWPHGTQVWLDAPDEVLLGRIRNDPVERPLLRGDAGASLAALRARREPFYRAAAMRADATPAAPRISETLVARLAAAEPSTAARLFDAEVPRRHGMGAPTARIVYGRGLLPAVLDEQLGELRGAARFVVDRRVGELVTSPRECTNLLHGGERAKQARVLERLMVWLAEDHAERGDPIVAVGGGTVGDVAGLAAALYARGVPWIVIPTTWLAQTDAALGGKVAVDLPGAKNAVGAFWPPNAVIADVDALRSLPQRHARNGLVEAIKAGLIADSALFDLIEARGAASLRSDEAARYAIIERAARVKLAIVDRDPFELGERRVLNLGHTIGHALEVVSRYRLPHGAAVALGLCAVAQLGAGRGGDRNLPSRITELLRRLGLRTRIDADGGAIRQALVGDKKRRAGRLRWILPMAVGSVVEVDDVTDAELDAALGSIGIGA
jgi:3-dehydroquinate synthetase